MISNLLCYPPPLRQADREAVVGYPPRWSLVGLPENIQELGECFCEMPEFVQEPSPFRGAVRRLHVNHHSRAKELRDLSNTWTSQFPHDA